MLSAARLGNLLIVVGVDAPYWVAALARLGAGDAPTATQVGRFGALLVASLSALAAGLALNLCGLVRSPARRTRANMALAALGAAGLAVQLAINATFF